MKNNNYWDTRKSQRMWEYMESAEDTADEISKLYLHASKYLNHEINGIFDRYAAKHKLSKLESKQLLNSLDDPTNFQEMLNRLKAGVSSDEKDELIKMLEAPAYRSRINRLEKLQSDIDVMMKSIYQQEKDFNTVNYINVAHDAYYKSIYDIQSFTGYGFSFNQLNPATVDKLLHSKWSGLNYSDRIWNNTQAVAKDIKEQLLMATLTGKTEKEVAEEISNKYNTAAFNSRRLVRTESNYIAEELEAQSYKECGAEKYVFLATLDLKTSEACRELDMKTFLLENREVGVNYPPMHPSCRSTTIIGITDEMLSKLKRRAKDPETGENYTVDGNTSYKKWYADQEEKYGTDKMEIFQKKIRNLKSDEKLYDKYKIIYNDHDALNTFETFQDMKYNNVEEWNLLKAGKQDELNKKDFSEISQLEMSLGDKEVREWYKYHDEQIPSKIDKSKSIEHQAREACELRNTYRTQARDLMRNQDKRKQLDIDSPNKTFDELIESKMKRKNMTREEAIRDVYSTATKTNKTVNKQFGLE